MSATIKILGWKSTGFRSPDHKISLLIPNSDKTYPISLIQMPNGTGKTTTLNLIHAALSGAASSWSKEIINGFCKRGNEEGKAKFELELMLNNRKMTVVMDFNFEFGLVQYKTTYGSGQELGFQPPIEFRKFLSDDFVKFYVFDGELAETLLDHRSTNAENVIEHLFQINHLIQINGSIEEYWKEETSGKSANERGLSRAINDLNKKQEQLSLLIKNRDMLTSDIDSMKRDLHEMDHRYSAELNKLTKVADELERLLGELNAVENEEKLLSADILDKMTNPTNLSRNISAMLFDFKNSLDRVKLPETAAREFFQELADEKECVCGRPIDAEVKKEILTRAENYLGNDDVALLNSIKSGIEENVGQDMGKGRRNLDELFTQLHSLVETKSSVKQDLELLRHDAENDDPELEKIRKNLEELKVSLAQAEDDLSEYSQPGHEKNIVELERSIEDLEEQVAERTQTYELKRKKTILTEIIKNAHLMAKTNISTAICKEANERIEELMPHNFIRISNIDKSIRLQNNQAGGSVGEQLSVAYAFLSTLFKRSNYSLPFIIDSPVGPIDGDIRREIAKLIPRLGDQFLAFTISTERQDFLSQLEKSSGDAIQYLTLFREGKASYNKNMNGVITTKDGVIIEDMEYFKNFQLEEE